MSLFWEKSSVLVTGASGFVGSHLCPRLIERGATVHGVTRDRVRVQGSRSLVQWQEADLSDLESARRVVKQAAPDCVFHLASIPAASRDLSMVPATFQSNLATTVNLLTALAEQGCKRVVLAGSLESPRAGQAPSSPYAAAKAASDLYANLFNDLYKLPIVTARLFMIYGPGQRDFAKLIPHTIRSLLQGQSPKFGPGTRLVDWVYVDDVAQGLIRCGESDAALRQTVDIGTGTLTSIRDVVETIAELVDPSIALQFGALPERAMEQIVAADVSATQQILNYAPKTMLRDGLAQTIEWFRAEMQKEPQMHTDSHR